MVSRMLPAGLSCANETMKSGAASKMAQGRDYSIDVKFYRLSPAIEDYFTALYAFTFDCAPDVVIEDYLHPEWTAMRFCNGPPPLGCVGLGPLVQQPPFVATGPTSGALHFGLRGSKIWGLGLQPLGWAKFACGEAADVADGIVDGMQHVAFEKFRAILAIVCEEGLAPDEIAARIDAHLSGLAGRVSRSEAEVLACQNALRDPDVATVTQLADRLGLGARALERLCRRYFGFPPKLLLRRQRFLRSLARYMLVPKGSWSTALDGQYYDQAQFVKEFHAFMQMTPTDYAEMEHPVLGRIMAQRMADQGAAPETDLPTILRYASHPR